MAAHDRPQTSKSVFVNIWSILTIILPIVIIWRQDLMRDLAIFWAFFTVLMLSVPPRGWLRPHPYSDVQSNRRR